MTADYTTDYLDGESGADTIYNFLDGSERVEDSVVSDPLDTIVWKTNLVLP